MLRTDMHTARRLIGLATLARVTGDRAESARLLNDAGKVRRQRMAARARVAARFAAQLNDGPGWVC